MQWGAAERAVDFFDVKGDVEALFAPREVRFVASVHPALHPGRSARLELDGREIGVVGELHPRWRQAYELPRSPLLFELDAAAVMPRAMPSYRPLSRQQPASRDLAVIVPDAVSHDELLAVIRAAAPDLVRTARLFDIYRPKQPGTDIGPGERSMAVRVELLDDAVTLTDERIDAAVGRVVAALRDRFSARLRA
jgi:phenylalanyl-tRNA synthetase beta chain